MATGKKTRVLRMPATVRKALKNAGVGNTVDFHGAFREKPKAVAKEQATPGAFIKGVLFAPGDYRYVVMTRKNPGRNPGELVVFGLGNPKRKGKAGRKRLQTKARRKKNILPAALASGVEQALEYGLGAKAVDAAARTLKKRAKRRRRNSDGDLSQAEKLYSKFHGRAPKDVREMDRRARQRQDYTALGELVAIGVNAEHFDQVDPDPDDVVTMWDKLPHLRFGKGVILGSSPDGTQLYVLGEDQEIDLSKFETDASKDLVDLGEATFVVYMARKAPSFEAVDWVHTFGEEGGTRPRLLYDKLSLHLLFAGGSYTIQAPGIIN